MTEVVYFIRHRDKIKIGTTSNLLDRFKQIWSDHCEDTPVLIGAIYGGRIVERACHHEFKAFALGNEWFSGESILLVSIDKILKRCGGVVGVDAFSMTENDRNSGASIEEALYVQISVNSLGMLLENPQYSHLPIGVALRAIADMTGITQGTLWGLKYCPPKMISAGVFHALTRAADALDGSDPSIVSASTNDGLLK